MESEKKGWGQQRWQRSRIHRAGTHLGFLEVVLVKGRKKRRDLSSEGWEWAPAQGTLCESTALGGHFSTVLSWDCHHRNHSHHHLCSLLLARKIRMRKGERSPSVGMRRSWYEPHCSLHDKKHQSPHLQVGLSPFCHCATTASRRTQRGARCRTLALVLRVSVVAD